MNIMNKNQVENQFNGINDLITIRSKCERLYMFVFIKENRCEKEQKKNNNKLQQQQKH